MPASYERYRNVSNYATSSTTYHETTAHNYYARLAEKAAPSGAIHLNSYETQHSYNQPVYYARAPVTRVVKEVVSSQRVPSPPTRIVQEKVIVREPVREPSRVVEEKVVRREVNDTRGAKVMERRVDRRDVFEEKGFVRNVAGKGVGAVWKALGGK